MTTCKFQLGQALKQSVLAAAALVANVCAANAQGSADQSSLEIALIAVLIVGWIIYIVPTIIAFRRKHHNRWLILVVNVVFGATGLGWLGSLVWACSALHIDPAESNVDGSTANLPAQGEALRPLENAVPSTQNDTPTQVDPIERLTQLQSLRDSGALDDSEFEALKAKVLR